MSMLSPVRKVLVAALLAAAAVTLSARSTTAQDPCGTGLPYCTNDRCECEADWACYYNLPGACDPGEICLRSRGGIQ